MVAGGQLDSRCFLRAYSANAPGKGERPVSIDFVVVAEMSVVDGGYLKPACLYRAVGEKVGICLVARLQSQRGCRGS